MYKIVRIYNNSGANTRTSANNNFLIHYISTALISHICQEFALFESFPYRGENAHSDTIWMRKEVPQYNQESNCGMQINTRWLMT